MLRLTIEPGFHEEEKLQSLYSFCREARIDDVMFFILGEELNTGHPTREEAKPWVEMIARAKKELATLGVTTSINPWTTMIHADRGRAPKPGQNFGTMVGLGGRQAQVQACPLDKEWRTYICDLYAYYSQVVEPYVMWIEDDFRLHNHPDLEWGGCFCDQHMARFSERAGKKLTRDEFVEGLLRPGEPHSYRKIWLDLARETMVDLAREIGEAVHAASPSTRVGLMSSTPEVHCAEARDWDGVLNGFAGPDFAPICRPHLPGVREVTGAQYLRAFREITALTQHVSPESTEFYPELEGFPHTRFAKSRAFMRFQLETSSAIGSKGITLNIFDMMGNGVLPSEGYQETLAKSKPYLEAVADLELTKSKQTGVKVLMNTKSSYTLHTAVGRDMAELYPSETFWPPLLSALGIANTYAIDTIPSGEVVAVSGQYFRNLGKDDVRRLFADNLVMINGEAAHTLHSMGMGELAGILNIHLADAQGGRSAYEQVCDGKTYAGLPEARISSQYGGGLWAEVEYGDKASVKTMIKDPTGKPEAPGLTVWDDRVVILPYRHDLPLTDYHPARQDMLQTILRELCVDNCPVYAIGVPYVHVFSFELDGRTALFIANSAADEVENLRIHAPHFDVNGAEEISRISGRGSASITRDGDDIIVDGTLSSLETRTLLSGRSGGDL